MCGIVGYIGSGKAQGILIDGLKKLEYRGYDSAGIAIFDGETLIIKRTKGKIRDLEKILAKEPVKGSVGIAHTRWATHGKPSEENAHPHRVGPVAVVHNGIIENHIELRKWLESNGHEFSSETDTEIFAHLIEEKLKGGSSFLDSVLWALKQVSGSYAIVVINEDEPDKLIGARSGSPLILGLGEGEYFLASDIPAILSYTRNMVFLEDGDVVTLSRETVKIFDIEGKQVEREPKRITWDPGMAEKSGYKHFMQKEIFEQPRAIADTLTGRVFSDSGEIRFEYLNMSEDFAKKLQRITIVACGTSWHAGLVGRYYLEKFLRIPVDVELGSEYRYRDPVISDYHLVIGISQSGETADTIAGLKAGKERGARILSICNVIDSSVARMSDDVLYTHAGPEIGVASTKAFTTQIVTLYMLSLLLAKLRGDVDEIEVAEKIGDLLQVPSLVEKVLKQDPLIEKISQKYYKYQNFLYLGRHLNFPIALEGALKLKEISYIHAEGYPAGEMKHGPIALIDENLPVVAVATRSTVYEKIYNNIEEVKARNGEVIALASEGDKRIKDVANEIIYLPFSNEDLSPVINVIPLQLFAYHVAVNRGTDVDQPRNLAKSVTVE